MSAAELFPVTLMEMIAELERELALRTSVYPRWVAAGKLKKDKADRQIAVLRRAYITLQQLNVAPEREAVMRRVPT